MDLTDLMQEHSNRALGYLMRHGLTQEDAEDVLQESWLVVWQCYDPARGSVMSYLLHIAHRRMVDQFRRYQRWDRLIVHLDAAGWARLSGPRMELAAHDHLLLEAVRAVPLTPNQRAVFELRQLECTDPEAAAMLGIPVGSVKSRLHRARLRLLGVAA